MPRSQVVDLEGKQTRSGTSMMRRRLTHVGRILFLFLRLRALFHPYGGLSEWMEMPFDSCQVPCSPKYLSSENIMPGNSGLLQMQLC